MRYICLSLGFFICFCGFVSETVLLYSNQSLAQNLITLNSFKVHTMLLAMQSLLISVYMCKYHRIERRCRERITLFDQLQEPVVTSRM